MTEFATVDDPRHERQGANSARHRLCRHDYCERKTWLVHHLLAVGELSAFYGEPGSGKSVLAQDIGLHLAAGCHGSAAR